MSKRNACPGFCCMAFSLAHSPSKIARMSPKRVNEVDKIKDMLIHLGKGTKNPVTPQTDDSIGTKAHFYTCKFFDAESRSCLDYENRPRMCRDFPYGRSTCPYEGCNHYNGRMARLPVLAEKEAIPE